MTQLRAARIEPVARSTGGDDETDRLLDRWSAGRVPGDRLSILVLQAVRFSPEPLTAPQVAARVFSPDLSVAAAKRATVWRRLGELERRGLVTRITERTGFLATDAGRAAVDGRAHGK